MAASLSRPDPTSPASVAAAGFNTARRGYQPDEVRAFLTAVSDELRRALDREQQLEVELRAARAAGSGRIELDDATVTNLLGEETARVLQTARESAALIKQRAEESAARTLREAHDEANRLRQDAEVDAARRRQEAQSEAEAEVALAKQQGREMVNEARAYRERVLADLERRTKLARQQIEELAHGRDRLLQVFERARLVAVDVTTELRAISEPDEYVNLAPTTGPVPVMVPGTPRPEPAPVVERATVPDAEREVDPEPEVEVEVHAVQQVHEVVDVDRTDDVDAIDAIGVGESSLDTPFDDRLAVDIEQPRLDHDDDGDTRSGRADLDTGTDAADADQDETQPVDDGELEAVAPSDTAAPPARGNVVALFPGRAAAELAAAPSDARPAVDDLFARLRTETGSAATQPAEPSGAEPADARVVAQVSAGDEPVDQPVDQAAPSAFSRRDEAIVPLIVTAARKLKRVLADEQNGVLDSLRRREPVRELADLVPSLDEHVAAYVDSLADELVAAAVAGAHEHGVTDSPALRRTVERSWATDPARTFVRTDLVVPLRDRLERSIMDGAGDNDDITRRVRAVYREWKTQHIDDLLDDVFRFAFGGGLAALAEPGTQLTWTIDPSEPACADCEDNSLAGPVAAGEPYPTGHTMAPAHPGCRCLTLPLRQ
jgi:DivIVA domain-containing protein